MPKLIGRVLAFLLCAVLPVHFVRAAEDENVGAETDPGLRFTHPIVSATPSPNSTITFDYSLSKKTGGNDELLHGLRLEGEYAPVRWLSLGLILPYGVADRDEEQNRHNLDDVEVSIKVASFALEDEGVLLGGGIGSSLPTGSSQNRIGSDRLVVIEPYLDLGGKRGRFESVAFLKFGFPVNENGSDRDWQIGWNLSLMAHLSPIVAALLEFDGERGWGGDEGGETIVNVTPGLRWNPADDPNLWFGTGVSLPLTHDEAFDVRWLLSAFYHF